MENSSKKRRRLSAEEKWSIYQECEQSGVKIGEVLRKHGLYSSDLQLIRREVKEAALERLSRSRPGRKKAAVVPVEERDQLKRELEEKEKALAELSVMFTTLKKKSALGIEGPFPKGRLPLETRQEVLQIIDTAKGSGIARHTTCSLLQISIRRVERWECRLRRNGSMAYEKPGPQQPAHALMPAEKDAVLSFAGREDTVDYSLQLLAIKGAEANAFYLSASSVRLILQENGLGDDRTGRVRNSTRRNKPDRPDELTGPNQCWCWDVSYIKTDVLRVFWYLYVMLDEWSRKVVAWRISRYHNHEEAMGLIDDAIIAEGLLDIDKENLPVVVNDRGVQMKAKDVKQMFTDLGLTQTFSRPRTPNDNPFIESFFSSLKRAPVYPGRFSHFNEGVVMDFFGEYFRWYNTEHYHSRIGCVTPEQMH